MSEYDLQKKCNELLDNNGILYYHKERGRHEKNKAHSAGLPDLIIWHNKKTIFIELKEPGKDLSKDQIEFKVKAEAQEIPFYVCDNFHKFIIVLDQFGVINYDT